jgi:hypothetical protein
MQTHTITLYLPIGWSKSLRQVSHHMQTITRGAHPTAALPQSPDGARFWRKSGGLARATRESRPLL